MSEQPAWSRRKFLSARGLGASAGGLIGSVMREDQTPACGDQPGFGHWCVSRRAMGCEFTVYLPPTGQDPLPAATAALAEIEEIENLLTVYRADSLMSYVNCSAADGPVRVDHRLYRLLERSAQLTEQTQGAFDVSAGALVNAWGFVIGPKRVPSESERRSALARTGMQHVELDDHEQTVRYHVPGLEINLGSIGKGFGIDRAIDRLGHDFQIDCAMIQGGQSSLRAIGEPAGKGSGWLVGIQNPFNPSQRLATVRLQNRSMGTSGAANQYFEADGRRYGHVLDPRTGLPADELASATVLAPDATTADALATALFVMGLDKAADFCDNHPAIAALLVLNEGGDGDANRLPRVETFNLPPEDVNRNTGTDLPGT